MLIVGIAHPGEMGTAVGATLVGSGTSVLWASAGRSTQTRERAAAAQLEDVCTLAALSERAEVLLSICPPHAAVEVAHALTGYRGVYVDANAIAPQTAEEVAEIVTSAGASFVDGGIIGPPPREAGRTRLYLSGAGAGELAPRLATALLDVIALDGTPTAASALKMTFAGWSKGYAALLLTIRAAARQLGVEGALLAQWRQSQPDLVELSERLAAETSTKAWRWTGEMDEIALTLASSGLPSGFHEAASEVYRRMGSDLDPQDPELLARLLEALADPPARTSAG